MRFLSLRNCNCQLAKIVLGKSLDVPMLSSPHHLDNGEVSRIPGARQKQIPPCSRVVTRTHPQQGGPRQTRRPNPRPLTTGCPCAKLLPNSYAIRSRNCRSKSYTEAWYRTAPRMLSVLFRTRSVSTSVQRSNSQHRLRTRGPRTLPDLAWHMCPRFHPIRRAKRNSPRSPSCFEDRECEQSCERGGGQR